MGQQISSKWNFVHKIPTENLMIYKLQQQKQLLLILDKIFTLKNYNFAELHDFTLSNDLDILSDYTRNETKLLIYNLNKDIYCSFCNNLHNTNGYALNYKEKFNDALIMCNVGQNCLAPFITTVKLSHYHDIYHLLFDNNSDFGILTRDILSYLGSTIISYCKNVDLSYLLNT